RCIERVHSELIAVLAAGRTRAAVSALSETVSAADALRRLPFGDIRRAGGDVPDDPVIERAAWSVGIINDQRKAFRVLRNTRERQWRVGVRSIACIFRRNRPVIAEGWAGDVHAACLLVVRSCLNLLLRL